MQTAASPATDRRIPAPPADFVKRPSRCNDCGNTRSLVAPNTCAPCLARRDAAQPAADLVEVVETVPTVRVSDDGAVEWEGPLAAFLADNSDDEESCEQARALKVGDSVVMGMGFVVERIS
jgi:hypothetical protein